MRCSKQESFSIDLMIGKPGPFQVIESDSLDVPHEPPKRRYSCSCYDTCLELAAALNWDSFTCRGCSGVIQEALFWRARQAHKKDSVAKSLCALTTDSPTHEPHSSSDTKSNTKSDAHCDEIQVELRSAEAAEKPSSKILQVMAKRA